jgi:hypothetical protein
MADMVPEQTDVNSQEVVADSSPAMTQEAASITPTLENKGEAKAPENKVPQGRFNEVIQERNSEREARERLEARIRELETVRQESGPKQPSVVDLEVKRLVEKLGMEESAAREIVNTYQNLSQAQRREQEVAQNRFQAESWANQKAEKDPIYREIEPELDKSFSSLKPVMQQLIAQNADALEMFYENVKARHLGSKSKESYSKGAEDALKNKLTKQAISSVPGASSSGGKTALTRKSLAEMDNATYMKRLPEINDAIKNGTLK